jgi:uncharacterized repeat protein (TIGR02543 family)
MRKGLLQALIAFVIVATVFFFCANPQNPFGDPGNAKISLAFKDSKGQAGANLGVSDTVGNTVKIGVCPYLSNFIDSVTITILKYRNNTDSVCVIKNFSSDIDTLWNSFTFTTAGKWNVAANAVVQGGRLYALNGVITICGKIVSAAIQPLAETITVDSTASFTVSTTADTPVTYQWYHDTAVLAGQTLATWAKSHVALSDSGNYKCLVRDKWGDSGFTVPSAVLTVTPKVLILANTKPKISVNGHSSILSTEICSLTVSATDPDSGQTHVFAVVKAPAGYAFASNLFTWAPTAGYLGTDTVKTDTAIFTVTDNGAPPLSDTQKVAIVVSLKIFPPDSVRGITPVSRISGAFTFDWRTSANADLYVIYRSRDTTGFAVCGTTPDTMFANVIKDTAFYYYVVATNSKDSSARSQRIRSTAINAAPRWAHGTINVTINEGVSFSLDLADSVSDVNGDDITLQIQNNGSVNDVLVGTVWKYTPTYSDSGLHTITIKAWDGMDSSIVTLAAHVVNVPRPPLPQAQSLSTSINTPLTITLTAIDSDGNAITAWAIDTQTAHGTAVLANASQPMVTYTPTSGYIGSDYFIFRATAGSLSSAYSAKVTIVVANATPGAPALVGPADGAANQPVSLLMSWEKISNAATYYLQVSTDSTFTTINVSDSTLTDTTKSMSGILNGMTYYWRVSAKNTVGVSAWSARRKFTTIIAAPAAPALTTPANGTSGVAVNPTLAWTATDADSFKVQLSTASDFSGTLVVSDSLLTTTTKPVSGLLKGTKYYWHVRAKNGGGIGAWSATDSFTTIRQFSLSITAASGTVAISPNQTLFDSGAVVTLTATPNAGYQFTGWSGDTSGATNPVTISMTRAKNATATFSLKKFALNITVTNGTVATTVGGSPVTSPLDSGTVVALTATPNAGYQFAGWSGDTSGATNPVTITMTRAKNVTATFSLKKFVLNITAPNGIVAATVGGNPATSPFDSGTVVTLTATPTAGYQFTGWSGDTSGATNPVTITMTRAKNVTATFSLKKFALNISPTNGTVATTVGGSPATSPFDSGTVVTITANPAAGYHFSSWGVDLTGTTNPTTIAMTGPKSITANFTINAPPAPMLIGPINNMVSPTDTICWWGTASTATSYKMQVSTSKSLTSFAVNDSGLSTTYDSVKGLATSTKYYWRAGATNPGGTTWSSVDSFITTLHWTIVDGSTNLSQFAQAGGNFLAAGNGNGIMLSTDSGASWSLSNTGLTNLNITAFAVDGAVVYAGASSGSGVVFRSRDFGASWTRMNLDSTRNVQTMTASKGYVFAGTSDSGVYVSSDSGKTWSTRNNGLITLGVQSLKSIDTYIFLANNEGVHTLFYNAGPSNSWTVSKLVGDAVTLAVSGTDLYTYVSGDSIYRSQDKALTWSGIHPPKVSSSAPVAVRTNELFFGNALIGVSFSANYGAGGWATSNDGMTIHGHPDITGIEILGKYVIAANDQGLYRSFLP